MIYDLTLNLGPNHLKPSALATELQGAGRAVLRAYVHSGSPTWPELEFRTHSKNAAYLLS